jgi:hypothetical protein
MVSQRQIIHSTGFCEVKAEYTKKSTVNVHLDLLRLGTFNKDAIDNEATENIILVQAVGKLSVYYYLLLQNILTYYFSWYRTPCDCISVHTA